MPLFEVPLTISSVEDHPSIGSVITDIDVKTFINACSDEEFEHLVLEIRAIALHNDKVAAPPGLRQLSDEEVKTLGLPPLDENGNPIENNVDENEDKVKSINRKPINRANKRKKK